MQFATLSATILATSLVMTASARAADLHVPFEQPFMPEGPAETWSGFYAGVHLGYGWGEADDTAFSSYNWRLDGFIAGGQAGFNHQVDGIVLGVEADIAWTGLEGPYLLNGAVDDADYVASITWMSTVRGRVGVDLDGLLLYGTAGLAIAELDLNSINDSTEIHVGYALGAGIEKKITETISLRAEYLYADFGQADHFGTTFPVTLEAHTLRTGLNFHF